VTRRLDAPGPDAGFTLIEVLVSLAVISTMMASLSAYFVSSIQASRGQSHIQVAVRIAQAGMEQARGYGGATLLYDRKAGYGLNVTGYDMGYMTNTLRWDANAGITGAQPAVPFDNAPETIVQNGITYYRYWFVGKCWQAATGGLCTTTTAAVPMVRLVVGVIWFESTCPGTFCVQASTALFSADPTDPVFP
jgi:prepilin-type N-terminal cleavage/methylation domain-containing protein